MIDYSWCWCRCTHARLRHDNGDGKAWRSDCHVRGCNCPGFRAVSDEQHAAAMASGDPKAYHDVIEALGTASLALRLPDGRTVHVGEWRSTALYSSMEIPAWKPAK